MHLSRLLLAPVSLALLAACGGSSAESEGEAVSGEVLEGTISDAMLPLDRVRSQAPLAEPEARTTGAAGATGEEDGNGEDTAEEENGAEPEPPAGDEAD